MSFEEASTVFTDENARLKHDPDHSQEEDRFNFRKQATIRLGTDVIAFFKALARETGVPYQNLINLYLSDCTHSGKKLTLKWAS